MKLMDAWRMFNNFLKLWLLFSTEEGFSWELISNGAFVITKSAYAPKLLLVKLRFLMQNGYLSHYLLLAYFNSCQIFWLNLNAHSQQPIPKLPQLFTDYFRKKTDLKLKLSCLRDLILPHNGNGMCILQFICIFIPILSRYNK